MTNLSSSTLLDLKISCFSNGIHITERAKDFISEGGQIPLSIHEYVTTGGVTLKFPGNVFINAPFDEWYCDNPVAVLDFDPSNGITFVIFNDLKIPVEVLPLPDYLRTKDSIGNLVSNTVMTHADRVRISPIAGCSYYCDFCDYAGKKYILRPLSQILEGLKVSLESKALEAKHILISGGTPSKNAVQYIDEIYEKVIRSSTIPVDVMLAPRDDDIIEKLSNWGIHGYAINIEIFNEDIAKEVIPSKHRIGIKNYARSIEKAVELVGKGRVRSLLVVGLESEETTLEGVEFLAKLGCDPVLSPFRPTEDIKLRNERPPSANFLKNIYLKSLDIVEKYGVKLGPRCIPCQHNTLTLPDDSLSYYYS
jgi:hypothetical protein